MKLEPKKSVSLSSITFFVSILIGAMGWIITLSLLQSHEEGLVKELLSIGMEVLKVVVIAAAAAIAVERFLHLASEDDPNKVMRSAGIQAILPRRLDAFEALLRYVQRENIHHITICGISLRDFLLPGGSMHEVWRGIRDRLRREQAENLLDSRRLHVRLLLLLPNSDEGFFRHAVESYNQNDPSGIPADIPSAVKSVQAAQQDIFGSHDTPFLEVRLYEHCPFAFMFVTDTNAFVEQYDYHDQGQPAAMPLLDYQGGTSQYKELTSSLDVIWKHARAADLYAEVGTAAAIREARVENVFRSEQKAALTLRQVRAIQDATSKSIDVQAISGKFYVSNPHVARVIQQASLPTKLPAGTDRPGVPVRFLIINPVSQQAILRAIADTSPPALIGEELHNWDWLRHQQTDLYRDARNTAHMLHNWAEQRQCQISVRMYSSSVACMILQTDNRLFVEQYVYGRSKVFQQGFNLGGEYPVIEYNVTDYDGIETVEQQVVAATFEMVWKFYSISWENYLMRNEEDEFKLNVDRLIAELRIATV